MADEREQRVVEKKVHLKRYQKDHWVVSLRVPGTCDGTSDGA